MRLGRDNALGGAKGVLCRHPLPGFRFRAVPFV